MITTIWVNDQQAIAQMQISACVRLEIKVILCLDPDLQEFVKRIKFKKDQDLF